MRSQTVGSGSSGVAAVGSSGSASCFSSPPEPGTLCERGTRPSCQSSFRLGIPKQSQAPETISVSRPCSESCVRCARSRTLWNDPSRSRSSTTAFASASPRSEEHTSELQSRTLISYAVFCLKKKKLHKIKQQNRRLQKPKQ